MSKPGGTEHEGEDGIEKKLLKAKYAVASKQCERSSVSRQTYDKTIVRMEEKGRRVVKSFRYSRVQTYGSCAGNVLEGDH